MHTVSQKRFVTGKIKTFPHSHQPENKENKNMSTAIKQFFFPSRQ